MTVLPAPTFGRSSWPARLVAAILVLASANVASTQFLAYRLHYHPALGHPVVAQFTGPGAWIGWKSQLADSAPSVFRELHAAQSAGVALGLLLLLAASSFGIRPPSGMKVCTARPIGQPEPRSPRPGF